jgi:hypothetical protein
LDLREDAVDAEAAEVTIARARAADVPQDP